MTFKYKALGLDTFTQKRVIDGYTYYLSCINKFDSREEAHAFGRNFGIANNISSFDVTMVLSNHEWQSRSKTLKEETLAYQSEIKEIERKPAAIEETPVSSFEGTPLFPIIENPVKKGQKVVSTDKGLYLSFPTKSGDHWEKVTTTLDLKNSFLYFNKEGELFVDKYKLNKDQNTLIPLFDDKKLHLDSYKLSNIYEKDGMMWFVFTTASTIAQSREPASENMAEQHNDLRRIFVTDDLGKTWNELPGIIKKDF